MDDTGEHNKKCNMPDELWAKVLKDVPDRDLFVTSSLRLRVDVQGVQEGAGGVREGARDEGTGCSSNGRRW